MNDLDYAKKITKYLILNRNSLVRTMSNSSVSNNLELPFKNKLVICKL